ncbi:MAG: thiamine pyrophosphate-binding protein [Gemmataceae bacterium]|nr:thiamine pyrophosphate-binding protein [Gemmataceae bacterium]
MIPAAAVLVRRLAAWGAGTVFGYPGGQLTPIYDALADAGLRHVLARHEQAAAFMADGWARATGKVGVCLAVCGPGLYNAATALAAAHSDSVPVLCLSGQVPTRGAGLRSGYYHENEQAEAARHFCKAVFRATEPARLPETLDRAWLAAIAGRPGPVLLEVPVDVLRTRVEPREPPLPAVPSPVGAWNSSLIASWERPLVLAGGGAIGAEDALAAVAERLGAPVFHTSNGKCVLPGHHPLNAGMPWMRATSDLSDMKDLLSPLFAQADGLLAVGCRFTQLATASWTLEPPPVIQLDIDPAEIGRHYPAHGVIGDARAALEALLPHLPPRQPWAAIPEPPAWTLPGIDAVPAIQRALPADAIVSADVTRLAYMLMARLRLAGRRSWLHPAGSVAMGYGLPAALGAKAAHPSRPVLCVVGDGGLQMSAMELATAAQERLPVVVLLVNDSCLTLIKATQERHYPGRAVAVDLRNPDFGKLAEAFGVRAWRCSDEAGLERSLREAFATGETALVELVL